MKRIYSTIVLCSLFVCLAWAQGPADGEKRPPKPSFEEFVKMKTDFVVREMHLNPSDSAAFVSIYHQLQKDKFNLMEKYETAIRRPARELRKGKNMGALTDADFLNSVYAETNRDVEDASLDLKYLKEFEKVLTARQLFDYKRAEEHFKRQFFAPHKNGGRGQGNALENRNGSRK